MNILKWTVLSLSFSVTGWAASPRQVDLCRSLTQTLPAEVTHGSSPARALVALLQQGFSDDYVAAAQLSKGHTTLKGYFSLAGLIAPSMHLPLNSSIAFDATNLRYLPYMQQNMGVLLIVDNAHPLTPRRAKAVVATAKRLNIKIATIWRGQESDLQSQKLLAYIAALTGGGYTNLKAIPPACGQLSRS